MLRVLLGVSLALLSGMASLWVIANQLLLGWDREVLMMGLVCASVFAGSVLLLARREAGRRMLRGAAMAFAIFFVILFISEPSRYFLLALASCVVISAMLSLRSIRAAMRETREPQLNLPRRSGHLNRAPMGAIGRADVQEIKTKV